MIASEAAMKGKPHSWGMVMLHPARVKRSSEEKRAIKTRKDY
jgi:hypothetical protein